MNLMVITKVFGVITSNGDIMPPFNTEAYIKFLEEVVLPRVKRVGAGRPYV